MDMQYNIANSVGLLVSLGFVWTHASAHLHPAKLPPRLISTNVLGPIALFMGCFGLELGIAVVMLHRQSWYQPEERKVRRHNKCLCNQPVVGLAFQFPVKTRLLQRADVPALLLYRL